jgi:anti-sigma factor RsiW
VSTTHDDIAELLGAYALNAVDPDERSLVDAHLADCPRCRAELHDHLQVAAMLGNAGGDAPEGLWERIAGTLEEAPPPMRLAIPAASSAPQQTVPARNVVPIASRRRTGGRVVVGLVGAAAALVIALLGVKVVEQDDELDRISAALEADTMLSAANAALLDPDAIQTTLTSADGRLSAAAVVLPDGTGYLMADGLPGLDSARTYQLWGQTGGGLISLGLLGAEPGEVVPFQAGGEVAALAITEEVSGGVAQSENPPTVIGRFT